MGGSYSDLNIYFHTKKGQYSTKEYTVTTTQGNFPECSDFQVITHTIKFIKPADGRNYNVILYDGNKSDKGNYVFGYYYPRNVNEVIQEVRTYYSVLAPNVPLVISFKCHGNMYNCYFGKLKDAGWDRAYNISAYSFDNILSKDHLVDEYKKLLLNRKIEVKIGNEKVDIKGCKQELGYKENFRFIFIPKGDFSVLGSEYLFSLNFITNEPKLPGDPVPEAKQDECKSDLKKILCKGDNNCENILHYYHTHRTKINHNNQIDRYFLNFVEKRFYDGIMVYFEREYHGPPLTLCEEEEYNKGMALLLEFYDTSKQKIQIKRKDKDGYWWSQEPVPYNNDTELLQKLDEIKQEAENKNVVTVILDEKEQYKGVDITSETKKAYNKYTYTFEKSNKPVFLFERKERTFGLFDKIKTQKVEVYYLKAKDQEDKEPFLIVFFSGDRVPRPMNAYHFGNEYMFKGWKEFEFDFRKSKQEKDQHDQEKELKTKLLEKVQKIDDYVRCIPDMDLLRWYAYTILTDKEIHPPKPKETPPPSRPPEQQPPPEPKSPPISLIVGSSVGGGVFVVSSAVGYGVYWYNTTIKLLT